MDGQCCACGVTREELEGQKKPEPRCVGCGHTEGEGCGCPPRCVCGHLRLDHHWHAARGEGCIGNRNLCRCRMFRKAEPEPPMTPEEEEEAPEDTHDWDHATPSAGLTCTRCGLAHKNWNGSECPAMLPPPEGPEYTPCVCGHIEPEHEAGSGPDRSGCNYCKDCPAYRTEADDEEPQPCRECGSEADSWYDRSVCAEPCGSSHNRCSDCGAVVGICPNETPPPPQPERRPPYVARYSVGGHLYEVAVPGDACLEAVDGALVIRHGLGPVAGLTGFQPLTVEER